MSVFDDKPRPQGLKNPLAALPEIPPWVIVGILAIALIAFASTLVQTYEPSPFEFVRFSPGELDLRKDQNYVSLQIGVRNPGPQNEPNATLLVKSADPNLVVLPLAHAFSITAGDTREFEFQALPNPHQKTIPGGTYTLDINYSVNGRVYHAQTKLAVKK